MAPELVDHLGLLVEVDLNRPTSAIEDRFPHRSLISDISVKTSMPKGWGIKPLPEGTALQLKGILIECQCIGEGVQRDIAAYRFGKSVIRARGSISFDVPSEAHDSVWCLPLVSLPMEENRVVQNSSDADADADPPIPSPTKSRSRSGLRKILSKLRLKYSQATEVRIEREDSNPPSTMKCLGIGLRTIGSDLTLKGSQRDDLQKEAAPTFQRVGFVRLTLEDDAWRDYAAEGQLLRII